jgi:hypothetical protein
MKIPVCPICRSERRKAFDAVVLRKHRVDYYCCDTCGLVQTEEPYWLEESYSQPIPDSDTGMLSRNTRLSELMAVLIYMIDNGRGKYLDVAGGYGVLTRLMRDIGFDYYWQDKYADNLFARGFEDEPGRSYSIISAVEILEHIYDPVSFLKNLMERTGCTTVLATTQLYEGSTPPPQSWWYYSFEAGQHISLSNAHTIRALADRLDLKYFKYKEVHVLTSRPGKSLSIAPLIIRPLRHFFVSCIGKMLTSRTVSDANSRINAT